MNYIIIYYFLFLLFIFFLFIFLIYCKLPIQGLCFCGSSVGSHLASANVLTIFNLILFGSADKKFCAIKYMNSVSAIATNIKLMTVLLTKNLK